MSNATKAFKSWLTKARKKAELSYGQLAERSGVSTGTLWGLEHSDGSPSLDTAEKVAKALGTSLETAVCVRSKSKRAIPAASDPAADA